MGSGPRVVSLHNMRNVEGRNHSVHPVFSTHTFEASAESSQKARATLHLCIVYTMSKLWKL